MPNEVWSVIPEFTDYSISNIGRVYNNKLGVMMATSLTLQGHVKVSLRSDAGIRRTLAVSWMVARAFVESPDILCDHVLLKDGNLQNVAATNLEWRPYWFCYRYALQMRTEPYRHYVNLPIYNCTNRRRYSSIVECGIREGLLFEDIWRSANTATSVYPYHYVFRVSTRSMR